MTIAIIGTRGIPANYGGFETFAEELSTRLINFNIDVTVFCDKNSFKEKTYKNVKLYFLNYTKSKNPLLYLFYSTFIALKNYDIILVTSTAASYFYFFNLFFRKIIITNTDGVEYKRGKWSFFKKKYLLYSEKLAVNLSSYLIADSKGIFKYLTKEYKSKINNKIKQIEYGANIEECYVDLNVLDKYNLNKNDYFLVVARLEPENNILAILNGFKNVNTTKKLIIVGNKLNNEYVAKLLSYSSNNIIFLGGIYDKNELKNLRLGCYAYIHGHSVGGTNPSLLEALGSGNICICHDNIYNREVTDDKMYYFKNDAELSDIINKLNLLDNKTINNLKLYSKERIKDYYNWDRITNLYIELFNNINKNNKK